MTTARLGRGAWVMTQRPDASRAAAAVDPVSEANGFSVHPSSCPDTATLAELLRRAQDWMDGGPTDTPWVTERALIEDDYALEFAAFVSFATPSRIASLVAAATRGAEDEMEGTIRDCLAVCAARGWSLHWTARGAYLHLESSELIEAWRGKGESTVAEEAGDVLLVLFSILGASGVSWVDAVGCARAKIDDLQTRPRYPGEEYSVAATTGEAT